MQSSHVQVQQAGGERSDARRCGCPSEKLGAALASFERVAPVRDESQSLQDITNSYDAARQRLADATAERAALLRALAKASTEGTDRQLARTAGPVAAPRSQARASRSKRCRGSASTAEVEVTVLGDAHAGSEGLTLRARARTTPVACWS